MKRRKSRRMPYQATSAAKYDCRSNIQRIREFKVQAMFKNKVVGKSSRGVTQKEKCFIKKSSFPGKMKKSSTWGMCEDCITSLISSL